MNSRISIILLSTILLTGSFGIALPKAFAVVTPPSLGEADSFAILANTYTNTGNLGTVLNGDLGYTVAPAIGSEPTVNGITFASPDPTYIAAETARGIALAALTAELCDPAFTFGAATVLDSLTQPLTPGVYCIDGAVTINNGITLSGDGVYIFRMTGALDAVANSVVTLENGADTCKIFWTPVGATTLGTGSNFTGNVVMSDAATTVKDGGSMNGRILSFGAVTTETLVTITAPTTCQTPEPPPTNGAVGGTIIPIDMTSLFVAGAMTNAFWVLPTLGGIAGAAIALFKVKRKSS